MKTENRIIFKGNPWPEGHPIKNFVWSARLDANQQALFMDLHIETENYNLEDKTDDEGEPQSDWTAKIAWNNFHSCTMSSTEWHFGGISVGSAGKPFVFSTLDGLALEADPLPLPDDADEEELAFHIYLLGHDSCAGHRLVFQQASVGRYNLHWTGKLALTYIGENEFVYEFDAFITDVPFTGLELTDDLDETGNRALLEKCVADAGNFVIKEKKFMWHYA